jgi:hypothetical protein
MHSKISVDLDDMRAARERIRIPQRGLAKDRRLAKLSVIIPDRPASIVDLATIAASQLADILDIHHGRTFTSASFRETEIDLMVETRVGNGELIGSGGRSKRI